MTRWCIVVKFTCSALTAWGSQVWIQVRTYILLIKPCCGGVPYTKERKIGTDVSSGPIFLTKKKKKKKKERKKEKELTYVTQYVVARAV